MCFNISIVNWSSNVIKVHQWLIWSWTGFWILMWTDDSMNNHECDWDQQNQTQRLNSLRMNPSADRLLYFSVCADLTLDSLNEFCTNTHSIAAEHSWSLSGASELQSAAWSLEHLHQHLFFWNDALFCFIISPPAQQLYMTGATQLSLKYLTVINRPKSSWYLHVFVIRDAQKLLWLNLTNWTECNMRLLCVLHSHSY